MVNTRALVDEALRNPGLYSSEDLVEQGNTLPLIPLNIDPPEHVGYRKLLDPLFAPRRIDALEVDIAERVNHFIDGFDRPRLVRFHRRARRAVPSSVFLGMMGLPWEELDTLVSMRDGLLRPGNRTMAPEDRTAIQRETATRVYAYFDAILDARTANPQEDILSLFVSLEADDGRLTRPEVLAICFVLLTAGLDTVTDSLTCFFAFLAQNPEHRQRIVDDPDVIPNAVEELLRWETPVPSVVRWASEDATLGGEWIGAGNHVMVNLGAANLDPATFEAPMEVRFDREVNRHLAFGGGVHRCLGSHLARRELRIALREWHRRIPDYTLTPGYKVDLPPPVTVRARSAVDVAGMTRVVQWATGTTGRLALRAVIDAPDLELVGVRVYDPAKVGLDAGELVERSQTGIATTDVKQAILDLVPDVVLYMGRVEHNPKGCFADVVELLGTWHRRHHYGKLVHRHPSLRPGSSRVDCRGMSNAATAPSSASACSLGSGAKRSLRCSPAFPLLAIVSSSRETLSYAGYPSTQLLFDIMGYGHPADSDVPMMSNPTRSGGAFNGTATVLAKALGLEVA